MALSTEQEWETFFLDCGIPAEDSAQYATSLVRNRVKNPSDLTRELLKDLQIKVVGDVIAILKKVKEQTHTTVSEKHNNTTKATLPSLKMDITHPEFRKFKIDWSVYKQITCIPESQIAAQLYTTCDSGVQTAIINTCENIFDMKEDDLLEKLEGICTKKSNPAVHRLGFSNLVQTDGEPIQDYLVRLKSSARDCEFSCPSCKHDLSENHIKDQLIRGICNRTLQTDILANTSALNTLDKVFKHAQAFESAVRDQNQLSDNMSEAMRVSDYKQQTKGSLYRQPQALKHKIKPCPGCGSSSHNQGNRSSVCPAWGKNCLNCNLPNHFAKVCRQPVQKNTRVQNRVQMISDDPLQAYVELDHTNETYTSVSAVNNIQQIPAEITLIAHQTSGQNQSTTLIFPDSGAGICLAGTKHLQKLGISSKDLIPCSKRVVAVGGSTLTCQGWIEVQFRIGNHTTKQPLYICANVDRIYLSRDGCTDLNILPLTFPYPMDTTDECKIHSISNTDHARSKVLPHPPTDENIPKLKRYLVEKFPSVFKKSTPFSEMKCKPVRIHLKDGATPFARHTPIPIPIHWKSQVKEQLDQDVEKGIIEPVPIGEPVTWCSPMVVTTKKDGRPRRTVDLQKLNSQCLRETHHCESPFKLACQIPQNKKKTVIDATDGYHSIPLEEHSRHLTTFITEWGRYRYRRLPQGFVAAGDAYTRRYDEIIKNIDRKIKCVDDTLLYDDDINSAFLHTYEYLTVCEENGITLNEDKFQFCQDTVEFGGLKITQHGICPSEKILSAIRNFPKPTNITGARSWFGLVNQIAWAYSNTKIMEPFRDLVKQKSPFYWDATLDKLFEESKEFLIKCSTEGIQTFDMNRNTCLQTDWSRDGIGYLLLQQYCSCKQKSPVCCKDGWKLVFAGSRFTKGAELRYSATEGELLAVTWSLEHARMFILGCKTLFITTDHKPLLGILKDRDLNSIQNSRILNLKQRLMPFYFTTTYNPGKWQRGPDALSRYPCKDTCSIAQFDENTDDVDSLSRINSILEALKETKDTPNLELGDVEKAAKADPAYISLLLKVNTKFPESKTNMEPNIKQFWDVRDRLYANGVLVMIDDRIVIPLKLRPTILKYLHSAHQGVNGMQMRANKSVYWPGISSDIRNTRYNCHHCNERAPSNTKEPYCPSAPSNYPFQQICLDFFVVGHHQYMSCVDRFTGWLMIYHFPNQANAHNLVSICRDISMCYGVPEEISSDGGPQFTSVEFKTFTRDWGIRHRLSSVEYPQSNGRAELGVKTAKRIITDNTNPDGSLNNNKILRAVLQYRNTPLPELGLSPAQLLLHRILRDSIPSHPSLYRPHRDWLISAEEREKAFAKRNHVLEERYNKHSKVLKPLKVQTSVAIQEHGKWKKTGRIVETLPNSQYNVRVDGSGRLTLRNRKFLREIPEPSKSTQPAPIIISQHMPQMSRSNDLPSTPQEDPSDHTQDNITTCNQKGRELQNLADFNNKGLLESAGEDLTPRLRSGRDY